MIDFQIQNFDFSSTEITITALSNSAKKELATRYGKGCISINVRKSTAPDIADKLADLGFSIK